MTINNIKIMLYSFTHRVCMLFNFKRRGVKSVNKKCCPSESSNNFPNVRNNRQCPVIQAFSKILETSSHMHMQIIARESHEQRKAIEYFAGLR